MPGSRTVHISEPMTGALSFQIKSPDARPYPDSLLPQGLRNTRPIELVADPELGAYTAGTSMRLLYEPPTGVFQLLSENGRMLARGLAENEPERKARIRVRLNNGDTVHGFGGARPGLTVAAGSWEMRVAPSRGQPSSLALCLIRRARGRQNDEEQTEWLAVFGVGHAPCGVNVSYGDEGYLELTAAADDTLPLEVVFSCGTLPHLLLWSQQLFGPTGLPPAALLGLGTEAEIGSDEEWRKLLPGLKRFDFLSLQPGYQNGPRSFTFSRSFQGRTAELFREYQESSRLLLLSIAPAVFVEEGNRTYQQGIDHDYFCKTGSGSPFRAEGPHGDSVFPDLTSERALGWWEACHADLTSGGAQGFAIQQTELCPPLASDSFLMDVEHESGSHLRSRGAFPELAARAANRACLNAHPSVRPAVIADSVAGGIQLSGGVLLRAPANPGGLRESVERAIAVGLSGVPLVGFACSPPTKLKPFSGREFLLRRIEAGALLPLFLLGAEERAFIDEADTELRALVSKHIRRRYRLLPYFQTLLHRFVSHGEPVLQPVFTAFPEVHPDEAADQFMVGPHLLAAPVYTEGATSHRVFLPNGNWYEFETGRAHAGGHTLDIPVDPGYYPLFIRAGSIVPSSPARDTVRETLDAGLILEVYPAEALFGRAILDDGITQAGPSLEFELTGKTLHNGNILIEQSRTKSVYEPPFREVYYRLPGPYRYATVDGERREGTLENLMREDRLLDMYSHEVPLSAKRIEFHYSGSFRFS